MNCGKEALNVKEMTNLLCTILLPELLNIIFLGDLLQHIQNLPHQFLTDDFQHFVLLKIFSRNVQGEIIGIDNAFDKAKVFRHHFLEIVGDENTPYVQLDVVGLFAVVVEHGARRGFRHEED